MDNSSLVRAYRAGEVVHVAEGNTMVAYVHAQDDFFLKVSEEMVGEKEAVGEVGESAPAQAPKKAYRLSEVPKMCLEHPTEKREM